MYSALVNGVDVDVVGSSTVIKIGCVVVTRFVVDAVVAVVVAG